MTWFCCLTPSPTSWEQQTGIVSCAGYQPSVEQFHPKDFGHCKSASPEDCTEESEQQYFLLSRTGEMGEEEG